MSKNRKKIPARLRFTILRRDLYRCRYCGAGAPQVQLHVDHIVPVALGGTNDPSNLCAACDFCNMGKGAMSIVRQREIDDFLDEIDDTMQFIYCDPYITSLYGEPCL